MAKRMSKVGEGVPAQAGRGPGDLRDKLTPRYAARLQAAGLPQRRICRPFNRDNVDLVTEPIDKITGSGVATADGDTHEVDVLILATGFKVIEPATC